MNVIIPAIHVSGHHKGSATTTSTPQSTITCLACSGAPTDNDAQVRIGRPDRRIWVSCDRAESSGPSKRSPMANIPRHITCGTAPVYLFREHRFRFLATGQDTGGTYGAMEIMSPLNTGAGPHVHADAEEHFLLLTGEVAFYVADQSFIVRPGDFLHVPRGVIHHFKVLTPDAKIIATYTPAGEEQAFIHAATPLLPEEA